MSDLVVFSLERWDDVWRRNQYLIDGLLRADATLRVLFVEPAADPLHDLARRRRPDAGHRPRREGDTGRLWTLRPTKLLPRRLAPNTDERMVRDVARTAEELGFRDPLLWINDPRLAHAMTTTGWPTLYDITDDWLAASRSDTEWDRIARGEALLLAEADEVVACSRELVRRKSPHRPAARHPISLVPNAVDVESYARPRPRPDDLPAGRTALYAGTVHADRFDVDATARTARELSTDATVVLVGPALLPADARNRLADAGVVILGPRSRDALVGYLQHADVLLVPHVVDDFTDSLDPIKLYEYQAVGRPVVSTPVAGFRDADDERIIVAEADVFPASVARALRPGRPAATLSFHPAPSWDDRVHTMGALLRGLSP